MDVLKFSIFILVEISFFLNFKFAISHNILLLPVSMSSHQLYFGKLGHGLSKLGHSVEMLSASSSRIPKDFANDNFSITTYPVNYEVSIFDSDETSEKYLEYATSTNQFLASFSFYKWFLTSMLPKVDEECETLLDNKELMERIVNKSGFEFVILDVMATDCFYEIVRSMNVSYAILGIPFLTWHLGVPRLPSFVPNYSTDMSDRMNFFERFQTFLVQMFLLISINFSNRPDFKRPHLNYDFHLEKQRFFDIFRTADLHLYLEDLVMSYPRPNMPNVVEVGDLMAGNPGTALSSELNKFLGVDQAILLSFGSYLQVVSEDIARKYCKAFRQLHHIKIIWKLNDPMLCRKLFEGDSFDNLLILKWIPQNDLLADERIKIFLTHGGLNSMMESIYHAKPVIVFPLAIDQKSQAGNARIKNYGIHMDLRFWDENDLVRNINEILNNPIYANNANIYSEILKSKSDTPAERVSNAINFVLKFGSHHLKSNSLELYWFQFFMFDICILILLIGITSMSLIAFCCFCLINKMCSSKHKLKKM